MRDSQPRRPIGRGRRRSDGPRRPRSGIETSFPEEVARLEDALDALAEGPLIVIDPAEARSPRPERRKGPAVRVAGRSMPLVAAMAALAVLAAGAAGSTLAVREGLPWLRSVTRTVTARVEPADSAPADTDATRPPSEANPTPPDGTTSARTGASRAPAEQMRREPVRVIPEPGTTRTLEDAPPLPDLADVGAVPFEADPSPDPPAAADVADGEQTAGDAGATPEGATEPPSADDLHRLAAWLADPTPRARLQLAAVDTVGEAEAAWAELTAEPDSPLAPFTPTIEAVEDPNRTWHRLVVTGLPDTAAKAVCDRLLAAFVGCILREDPESPLQAAFRFTHAPPDQAPAVGGGTPADAAESGPTISAVTLSGPSRATFADSPGRDPRFAALLRVEIFRALRTIGYQPGTGIGEDTPAFRRAIRDYRKDTALDDAPPEALALAEELAALRAAEIDRDGLRDIARRRTEAIQTELRHVDLYARGIHGALDRATREAIDAYRDRWALPADISPLALLGHLTAAAIQRHLVVLGLYEGPVTGTGDGPTRAAVRTYRRDRGLAPADTVDRGLLHLIRDTAARNGEGGDAETAQPPGRGRVVGDVPLPAPVLR
ncbi:MAG: SPOR domain-containing protein [Azospirillaceae bacterium]